ncbi:D-alanine--D-alanine ligase family protein [Actinosynnema mirum]|uniref:D-alanine--D-alanine ligase n=1 Tax=Actinosynnema mirum (strain ATCC 29888 / DSM 43827 / JCM 3225 / NBRC 14064 / NCIMB 13271 / NRRL B-12336 / IMRU 3971 / 101) TaxID=446462 RepID=C6WG31_ACTMD|nr:D-alanine--D-alanine ligase family protein [Actinosynnema mirum]ACU39795.1 D-alanine/D-alanine ligase [Actinosynnema mirum DSM 43827]
MTQRKTKVAVVFGGRSSEHTVSCVSAGSVLAHLDRERFEVVPVGITRQGAWVVGSGDLAALEIRDRQMPTVDALVPVSGGELTTVSPDSALDGVDVVFPLLHGAWGEDGTVQGLLELADLPYVGPGVLASAAAMDKEFTKTILRAAGLEVGSFAVLRRDQATLSEADRDRLGLPLFVKPARAGSSVGITKVTDWADLDAAIAFARQTDPKVIIEAAVTGREVECGVLELPDGRVEASLPAELRVVGGGVDWYDFDAKYLDDVCEFDIPAKLADDTTERLRALAVEAFRALDCQGLARVDFFVTEDGGLVVNEINTMPGFTPISMYPRMWEVTGTSYRDLLTTLVETAIARGTGLR